MEAPVIATPRVVGPRKLPFRQGSTEWLEARRSLITATDLPVILGLSPWKCEQDLADEKLSGNGQESTLAMRVGLALEDLILAAYSEQTGNKARRVHGLWTSRATPWAAASPDATAAGRLVEAKFSGSRTRFSSGLPDDVACQVMWQLYVAETEYADVAALTVGEDRVKVYEVRADPTVQANLVVAAEDFRRRLAAGGPFAQSLDSLKRKYPADDGTEMIADSDMAEAVQAFLAVKASIEAGKKNAERLQLAIETRMGPAAVLIGDGFRVTWKRTKDRTEIDWEAVVKDVAPPEEVIARHTKVSPGRRPFIATGAKEGDAS